ncbi:MAG: hypothetical protein ACYTGB_11105, partial [Planctomycetota bacterium]
MKPPADAPGEPGLFPPSDPDPSPEGSGRFLRLPEEARVLGGPWQTLVDDIPELTAELERDFRFGQTVFPFTGGYRVGGSVKGGSSTTWRPAAEADFRAYEAWKLREGIPSAAEDLEAFELLAGYLAANQVELWNL